MIDLGKILKRGWHILWNYRVLWLFGLLLAITVSGGSSGNPRATFSGDNRQDWQEYQYPTSDPEIQQAVDEMNAFFEEEVEPLFATEQQAIRTVIWIVVAMIGFFTLVGVLMALIRYPTETAVIRMVDDYEETGQKLGFKQGWKLGWSKTAFQLWWIDFLVQVLPSLVYLLLLGGSIAMVVINAINNRESVAIAWAVGGIGCLFLLGFLFALGMVFLRLLRQFYWRAAALENVGTREAFRLGWETFKRNWQSAGLMWLVMFGLGIGFGLAGLILFFVLIPVMAVTGLAGLLIAAIPAFLFGWLTSLFTPLWVAILVGAVIGLPLFFTALFSPFILLDSWAKIFESSIWTLTYREIKVLDSLRPQDELLAEVDAA